MGSGVVGEAICGPSRSIAMSQNHLKAYLLSKFHHHLAEVLVLCNCCKPDPDATRAPLELKCGKAHGMKSDSSDESFCVHLRFAW